MKEKVSLIDIFFVTALMMVDIIINLYFNVRSINQLVTSNLLIILILIIVKFFPNKAQSEVNNDSKESQIRALIAYIIIQVTSMAIFYLVLQKITKAVATVTQYLIMQSFLIALILLIMFLWKVKFSSFKFGLNLKTLLLTVIVCTLTIVSNLSRGYTINTNILAFTIANKFFFPCGYEEVIDRGLLIKGLGYFNLSEKTINIIQCLLFGMLHFNST